MLEALLVVLVGLLLDCEVVHLCVFSKGSVLVKQDLKTGILTLSSLIIFITFSKVSISSVQNLQ